MLNLYNRDFPCLTLTLHSTQREDVLRRFLAGEKCFVPAVRGVAGREQSAVSFLGILSAAENCPRRGFSRMLLGSD